MELRTHFACAAACDIQKVQKLTIGAALESLGDVAHHADGRALQVNAQEGTAHEEAGFGRVESRYRRSTAFRKVLDGKGLRGQDVEFGHPIGAEIRCAAHASL